MNKQYQLEQLRRLLENPTQQSGIYLINTDLTDYEIETFIKTEKICHYIKETLIPSTKDNALELLIVGLCSQCSEGNIQNMQNLFLDADGPKRDTITYRLMIDVIKHLCVAEKTVLHIHKDSIYSTLNQDDRCKLKGAIMHHDNVILVISKYYDINSIDETIIKYKSLKGPKYMENKLEKVHISYKWNEEYRDVLNAIESGLKENNIPYSMDKYDIMYRGSIDDYEKEIGASSRVIMFVIPEYFNSLDCMFEMTQMFKNGNIKERIFPLVDMKGIPRNGDGLKMIKDYWQKEKIKKSEQISTEPGGSSFLLMEIHKIDEVIKTLDELWLFICRHSTGDFRELVKNNAALLIQELRSTLNQATASIDENFNPSSDFKPIPMREILQKGEKPIYIENNTGSIIIN